MSKKSRREQVKAEKQAAEKAAATAEQSYEEANKKAKSKDDAAGMKPARSTKKADKPGSSSHDGKTEEMPKQASSGKSPKKGGKAKDKKPQKGQKSEPRIVLAESQGKPVDADPKLRQDPQPTPAPQPDPQPQQRQEPQPQPEPQPTSGGMIVPAEMYEYWNANTRTWCGPVARISEAKQAANGLLSGVRIAYVWLDADTRVVVGYMSGEDILRYMPR